MNARAEAAAAQMEVHGWIDRYDRKVVAAMIDDAIETDRATRPGDCEEETLP
jgi:hypothetical protein